MNPIDFVKTIYLGDRACKGIFIYAWDEVVKIQVDEISRVRGPSGEWRFYNDENIVDGFIVFNDVKSLKFDPPGYIPNDYITSLSVELIDQQYHFNFVACSCVSNLNEEGKVIVSGDEITILIRASSIQLEDNNFNLIEKSDA